MMPISMSGDTRIVSIGFCAAWQAPVAAVRWQQAGAQSWEAGWLAQGGCTTDVGSKSSDTQGVAWHVFDLQCTLRDHTDSVLDGWEVSTHCTVSGKQATTGTCMYTT